MYVSEFEAKRNLTLVQNALQELFDEYVAMYNAEQVVNNQCESSSVTNNSKSVSLGGCKSKTKSRAGFDSWAQNMETTSSCFKSDLEIYLEEGRLVSNADDNFDVLQWWKANTLKFKVLSRMARDILSIPMSTVASESTFSAGGRILDQFRSSLNPETVQALICTGDWLRAEYKINKPMFVSIIC